jgi:hypothetical protein
MAHDRDDELRKLAEQGQDISAATDPGNLAGHLAGMQSAAMGTDLAERYSQLGARWLADPVPTHLDRHLVERMAKLGFRRESLHEVRIHRGTKAQAAADALGARAFAIGDKDVFFGRGEFDPHTRSGRAVIAHELAHVAPPSVPGAGGVGAGATSGGMSAGIPASFGGGGALLNEAPKRGDENAAEDEAHERRSRFVEQQAYAMEDSAGDSPRAMPEELPGQAQKEIEKKNEKIDPKKLEDKVVALLGKWERTEIDRGGLF